MVRLVCRHFAADERFARQHCHEPSTEILLTLPFSGIFAGFSACYSYSNHSQDHGQWQVCMCVCVCECVCCVLCACGKTLKTTRNREKCVWYGVCVVWCCEVRKCRKSRETLGKMSNRGLLFWHAFPGICRRFWPEVLTQTPKNAVFYPRS